MTNYSNNLQKAIFDFQDEEKIYASLNFFTEDRKYAFQIFKSEAINNWEKKISGVQPGKYVLLINFKYNEPNGHFFLEFLNNEVFDVFEEIDFMPKCYFLTLSSSLNNVDLSDQITYRMKQLFTKTSINDFIVELVW